jgi:hypothetical protein
MAGNGKPPARRSALKEIQAGLRMITWGLRRLATEARWNTAPRVRPGKVSPGRRIQGKYIGLIRNLPAKQKAKVRAVRAKQGVEAAIKMAREMRSVE